MYGLPQAGIIAQELLETHLLKARYTQSKITPRYWKHMWCPISFTLVVDNFGVKYSSKEHVHHLTQVLKQRKNYPITVIFQKKNVYGQHAFSPYLYTALQGLF
jgi:hypothetical protein